MRRIVFTGAPGTGKSTLIRALLAEYGVSEGQVLRAHNVLDAARRFDRNVHTDIVIDGIDTMSYDDFRLLGQLSYAPRRVFIIGSTPFEQWMPDEAQRDDAMSRIHCFWEATDKDCDAACISVQVGGYMMDVHRDATRQSWDVRELARHI